MFGCSSNMGPSPIAQRRPDWPNEPAGFTPITEWGFDEAVPLSGDEPFMGIPGWSAVSYGLVLTRGKAELVTDSSAPFSPPNVFDFIYPADMLEGTAPATVYFNDFTSTDIYAAFWWKASSPFDLGPNGNKIAFFFNGGGSGGGQQFLILKPDGRLHVLPEYPGDYRWRVPNVNATNVRLGVWHQIEWHSNLRSGTLEWWLDNVLQGRYTDVRNSHPFDMFQISPTWGGNSGARKRQTDHYWFDHVRLSAPSAR